MKRNTKGKRQRKGCKKIETQFLLSSDAIAIFHLDIRAQMLSRYGKKLKKKQKKRKTEEKGGGSPWAFRDVSRGGVRPTQRPASYRKRGGGGK